MFCKQKKTKKANNIKCSKNVNFYHVPQKPLQRGQCQCSCQHGCQCYGNRLNCCCNPNCPTHSCCNNYIFMSVLNKGFENCFPGHNSNICHQNDCGYGNVYNVNPNIAGY
jgi:hypothetical protein